MTTYYETVCNFIGLGMPHSWMKYLLLEVPLFESLSKELEMNHNTATEEGVDGYTNTESTGVSSSEILNRNLEA